MSVQMALLAPATRVASRKLGPTAGRRSRLLAEQAGGLGDEQVGEHVRQLRDARHEPVVGVGVDGLGARAEAAEQPVQALVEDAGGAAFGGGEIPGGAVEQVRAGVLHAGGLGAGERVPADEALVGAGVGEHALGGADVADDAVRAGAGEREAHGLTERADGGGDEHDVGAVDGADDVGGLRVDGAELERLGAHALVGVVPAHVGVGAGARGEADRAADQPHPQNRDLQEACPVVSTIRRR